MRKLRYWTRLLTAFLVRFKAVLFIGVIIGFFIFIASQALIPRFLAGSTKIIGVVGRYRANDLPAEILEKVGDGLTKNAEDGSVTPAIAESWKSSDDGKRWEFKLKKDIVWHDGSTLISTDINYTFNNVQIEYPDDNTIIFNLENPFAPFPSVVARSVFKKGLLGTGDWRVSSVDLSSNFVSSLTLKRQDETEIIKFFPTEERAKLAFKLGEVDILEGIIDATPFNEWNTVNIIETSSVDRFVAVFLNFNNPAFSSNKALRQALSYATDKKALGGIRALGPISPNSWAYNPQVKPYDFDAERARKLIDDNFSAEALEKLEIKLSTTSTLLSKAELIAKNWNDVGIKTTVQVTSVLPEDYEAFMAIYDVPQDPDQYSTWHSTQTNTNISNYKDERIDKLLEDGRLEINAQERKKIYLDFQRFLLEDAPAVFLYHPLTYTIIRK